MCYYRSNTHRRAWCIMLTPITPSSREKGYNTPSWEKGYKLAPHAHEKGNFQLMLFSNKSEKIAPTWKCIL